MINAAAAVFFGRNYEEDDYHLATAAAALAYMLRAIDTMATVGGR